MAWKPMQKELVCAYRENVESNVDINTEIERGEGCFVMVAI